MYSLRKRPSISYKSMIRGPELRHITKRSTSVREVYEDLYQVERIIAERKMSGVSEYLVKWEAYSSFDCTWEPATHLPCAVLDEFFEPSLPSEKDLQSLGDLFLEHIHRRLSKRLDQQFYIYETHTLFRAVFGYHGETFPNGARKLDLNDFDNLLLPKDWYTFIYTESGEGRKIDFPISIKPVLRWSKKYFREENNKLVKGKRKPIEVWRVEICTVRCNVTIDN